MLLPNSLKVTLRLPQMFQVILILLNIKENANLGYTWMLKAGNTKEGSITVPLTSCLTGLD